MFEKYHVKPFYYYTKEHMWVKIIDGDVVRVGITDYAQKTLKEVIFIKLPQIGVEVKRMEKFGEVESTKSILDLYMPVSGKVVQVNNEILNNPRIVNLDPYELGWLIELKLTKLEELKELLTSKEYKEQLNC